MADADDLVQDVIIKALDKGIPENRDPVPWLITVCKNMWVDQLRYREVRTRHNNSASNTEGATAPEAEVDDLHLRQVLESLQQLPDNYRIAVDWHR